MKKGRKKRREKDGNEGKKKGRAGENKKEEKRKKRSRGAKERENKGLNDSGFACTNNHLQMTRLNDPIHFPTHARSRTRK